MASMKVVGVDEFGGPRALQEFDVPVPEHDADGVLVRVHAAAVNPTDTLSRSGARRQVYEGLTPPFVPGMDVAGIVESVGANVRHVRPGDAVVAIVVPHGSHGGYSQFVALPGDSVVTAPTSVSLVEAATVPMNGLTARRCLDLLDLAPGATLAVTGAAGAFGGYVVELAKVAGLRVIADAKTSDRELVADLGADVIVERGPNVATAILSHCPTGVDAIADGSLQHEALLPALHDGGAIATVRGWNEPCPRGITARPVWVREYAREREKLAELVRLVDAGRMHTRVAAVFPAAEAWRAHELLEAGGTRGRFVLSFA
jgi:NADPH:quinone reductase-like Zn-dependent oxidoreductase